MPWGRRCRRAWPRSSWNRTDRPLLELLRRYARTHGPFTDGGSRRRATDSPAAQVEARAAALAPATANCWKASSVPRACIASGAIRTCCSRCGARRWRGCGAKWCRRSSTPSRALLTRWQGVTVPRRGLDALLDAIEILQGAALPVSELEREILPARVSDYRPGDLDALMAIGRCGVGGPRAQSAIAMAGWRCTWRSRCGSLLPPAPAAGAVRTRAAACWNCCSGRWAPVSSPRCTRRPAADSPNDTQEALWELVWAGLITNDTFHPLRNLVHGEGRPSAARRELREGPPGSPEFLRRFRARSGRRQRGTGPLVAGARSARRNGGDARRSGAPTRRSNCWCGTAS